jgi:hypothetical protein
MKMWIKSLSIDLLTMGRLDSQDEYPKIDAFAALARLPVTRKKAKSKKKGLRLKNSATSSRIHH